MPERGCGTREIGGIYLESRHDVNGKPIEYFIICPPREIEPDEFGLSPIGSVLFQSGEFVHVMDWVGKSHYPYVADFVEETRVMGGSRRIPKNTDFSLLGPGSSIFCVHEKAAIVDPDVYFIDWTTKLRYTRCPQNKPGHDQPTRPDDMCAGIWWKDFDEKDMLPFDDVRDIPKADNLGMRETKGGLMYGPVQKRPDDARSIYTPAIFMRLPITNIVVIHDPVNGKHEEMVKVARKSKLPILLEVA